MIIVIYVNLCNVFPSFCAIYGLNEKFLDQKKRANGTKTGEYIRNEFLVLEQLLFLLSYVGLSMSLSF